MHFKRASFDVLRLIHKILWWSFTVIKSQEVCCGICILFSIQIWSYCNVFYLLSNIVFLKIYFILLGILGKLNVPSFTTKKCYVFNKKALYLALFGWHCLDFPYLTIEHHDALIGTKTRIMSINQTKCFTQIWCHL